jgi:hypothetical protein
VSFLAILVVFALCALLVSGGMVWFGVAVAVLGFLTVMVVSSALQGIYVAALYRYATTGEVPEGYDPAVMEGAFAERKRLRKIFS